MKTYTLKLKTTSTTNYNLYDGTTLVSDTDLGTLFATAGEAYFVFDFNSLTPANTTSLTILDSNDTAVITNTGLSGIAENKNFKGTWSASAMAFDSFTLLGGVAMDEAQLSKLASIVKAAQAGGIKTLTTADYNWPTNNPDKLVFASLPSGVYIAGEDMLVNYEGSGRQYDFKQGSILIKSGEDVFWRALVVVGSQNNRNFQFFDSYGLYFSTRLANNLTTDSDVQALSAAQGRKLNNKIEERILNGGTSVPTTSTVGAVGTQYTCVNNGTPEVYVCTDTTGGTYTWTKIN